MFLHNTQITWLQANNKATCMFLIHAWKRTKEVVRYVSNSHLSMTSETSKSWHVIFNRGKLFYSKSCFSYLGWITKVQCFSMCLGPSHAMAFSKLSKVSYNLKTIYCSVHLPLLTTLSVNKYIFILRSIT